MGAAILAGLGIGTYTDVISACEALVHYNDEVYVPNPRNKAVYTEGYMKYQALYSQTKSLL